MAADVAVTSVTPTRASPPSPVCMRNSDAGAEPCASRTVAATAAPTMQWRK